MLAGYITRAEMKTIEPAISEWPQLKGMDAKDAKNFLEQNHRTLNVILVPDGSATTKDFRPDRVRVFYAPSDNVVVAVPRIG